MLVALRFLELLILALWLGGMAFFSFVVAPSAFAVLPTRQLAGNLVGEVISRLYLLSYGCALLYLIVFLLDHRLSGGPRRNWLLPVVLVALAVILLLLNEYWLGPQMGGLRDQMQASFGNIDHTPEGHALRVAFNRLHGVSATLMTGDLLLVAALLFLAARRLR